MSELTKHVASPNAEKEDKTEKKRKRIQMVKNSEPGGST